MKSVTMADVAKRANVSKSTVSQFLNERYEYMGEKTRKRIATAIEELGYSPNIVARSLKQKTTTTIGVIVANILHVFSTQVIRAIEDFCNDLNFHVIVCNADDDPNKEKRYIEMLRAKQVDGIIAFPTGANHDLYQQLIQHAYPIVLMDRVLSDTSISTVLLDNEEAAKLAVDEFVKKGYKRIGLITPPLLPELTPRIERVKGFKRALKNHCIVYQPDYLISTNVSNVQAALHQMLSLKAPPKAILALNDLTLFGILTYIKEQHISVPNELALIGIDDVTFASFYSPALTTIAQPAFAMGKKAAELLLNKILHKDNETEPVIHRFEPKLIRRESC